MDKLAARAQQTICLDFGNQEIKDIKAGTKILLQRLCASMGRVNPLFEVSTLVPCGSMEEETRNWAFTGPDQEPVIEFDFLAVLRKPSQNELTTIKHCHKFMQVIDEYDCLKHYYNKFSAAEPKNALQVESIAKFFQKDLLKSIAYVCECSTLNRTAKTESGKDGELKKCKKCTETTASGCLQLATDGGVSSRLFQNSNLVLDWTSMSHSLRAPLPDTFEQTQLDHVYVLVNLLPSFELLKMKPNDTAANDVVSENEHDCFLVPKTCSNNHPTCWKISNCLTEIRLLQNTAQEHRYAYMFVKFLSKCLFSGYHRDESLPNTYKIKTAVLHHIKTCSSHVCDLPACTRQLLHDLSVAYSTQILPDPVSGFNLLEASESEILPIQNHTWHENRCKLVSDCFNTVCDFFDNVQEAQGLSLRDATSVLQFIGRTYYTAWRQTEIAPVYDVQKDKLTTILKTKVTKPDKFADIEQANYSDLVSKRDCPSVHWTKHLKVWEYASVREMYAHHHFDCPDPPGKTPGREENILLQAQMTCDFFSWPHEDQQEWTDKLAHSENPDNIAAALKAVDMSSDGVNVRKGFSLSKTPPRNQKQSGRNDARKCLF